MKLVWWFYNKLERYCVRGLQLATWGDKPLLWVPACKLEFWMRGKIRKKV